MNKNKVYLTVIVVLVLSHIVLLSIPFFRDHQKGGPKKEVIKDLKLSKNQVADYDALIERHKKTMKGLNHKLRKYKNDLYSSLNNDSETLFSDSLNKRALDRLSIVHLQIEKAHYSHFREIKNLCGPDQKKRFAKLVPRLALLFFKHKQK